MRTGSKESNNERLKTMTLGLVVVVGIACAALLVRWTDTLRPPIDPNVVDESLYLNGKTARRISLGFNGLVRRLVLDAFVAIRRQEDPQLPRLIFLWTISVGLDMKLLAPLLDTATTLDPEFIEPYEFAAVVLPADRRATSHSSYSKRHRCKSKRLEALSPPRIHLLASRRISLCQRDLRPRRTNFRRSGMDGGDASKDDR